MAAQRAKWERVSSGVRSPLPTIYGYRKVSLSIARVFVCVDGWEGVCMYLLACPKERGSLLVFGVFGVCVWGGITYHIVVGPEIDVVKTESVVIEDMGDSAPPRWRNRTDNQYLYKLGGEEKPFFFG